MAILFLVSLRASAQESPTLAAMQDEMKRSMAELRMKGEAAPYYIAYEVLDRTITDVSGRLGAIVENPPRRTRTLRVEVRVGDHTFDSSRFVVQGFGGGGGLSGETVIAPLDDDYDAMRREIWLTTDAAYKRAITMFARKKAAFQNRTASDPIPDFSQEPPVETIVPDAVRLEPDTTGGTNRPDLLARVQQASAVFASHPDVDLSEVAISQTHGTRYYLNSEGFKTIAPIQLTSLTMYAETQAGDGMPVRQTFTDVGRVLSDVPAAADLVARATQIAGDVEAARLAPIGEEFAGPVLIDGIGGAQFVAETLVQMMQARRPPDAENPRMGQAPSSPFLNRTGLRVMADAFTASDTPSMTHFQGKPLAGNYAVDDEGMRAKDVTLVEKGRLVSLLTSRVPQKNFPRSNGHGRANTVLAGVFQIESGDAIAATELKEKYIALLKAQDKTFGYIVRGVRSDGQGGSGPAIDAIVKVTLDGKETPVRGMRFGTVSPMAFRDLAEASKERSVFSYRAGATAAVSVIAPSLIFEELEIQRVRDILQKPPVVPSPLKTPGL
ncbi:MAG TPA: metallopeptidase TldD-related protein [Vicinamibacterales bacterium]|nr:metallopeptidase TldD-related protein [Vicinamibacterales bacterium]